MNARAGIDAALGWLRKGDAARAQRELEALCAALPRSPIVHNALGSVLAATGQSERAAAAFRSALGLRPEYAEAATNLGTLLLEDGQVLAAVEQLSCAVARGTAPVQAQLGLGWAFCLLGRHADARAVLAHAAAHPLAHPATHSQRCYASLLDPAADVAHIAGIAAAYESAVAAPLYPRARRFTSAARRGARLKLGYVSADFREHSVASYLESVLSAHARDAFNVVLYSDVRSEDAVTARMRAQVDGYHSIAGVPHADAAERIRADGVDVLIDLSGHMQPNRLPLFARRPAPVLLSYLGYPATTGMSVFDARLSDGWADPIDAPAEGPERVVRIEGGYFAYTPPQDAPAVSELPARQGGIVTFGCMNDVLKVNDEVLACWSEILAAAPRTRLLLKARMLASADVRARVLDTLIAAGVSTERIELLPATHTRREHLQTYGRVDLALDTFPYGGATTTCESLYMGVPVVTLAGDRHAGRLSLSILSACGLSDFIAPTRTGYVEKAVALASEPRKLAALRRSLREQMCASPLCDGVRVARAIESTASDLARAHR